MLQREKAVEKPCVPHADPSWDHLSKGIACSMDEILEHFSLYDISLFSCYGKTFYLLLRSCQPCDRPSSGKGGSVWGFGSLNAHMAGSMKWPVKPISGAQVVGNFVTFSMRACSMADVFLLFDHYTIGGKCPHDFLALFVGDGFHSFFIIFAGWYG